MKEEIYLFYKYVFEPRLQYYKQYLLYFLGGLKFFSSGVERNKKCLIKYVKQYIFLEDYEYFKKNKDFYSGSIFLTDREFYNFEFDKQCIYVLVGDYEKIFEYLKYLRRMKIMAIVDREFDKSSSKKPIWKRRISVVEAVYSDLILEDVRGVNFEYGESDWIDFERKIFETYMFNKLKYKKVIQSHMKPGWTLSRINMMSSAVLFESLAEFDAHKTPINVLLEQSVKTAKNYCDKEDYKFINGLLETCLKNYEVSGK